MVKRQQGAVQRVLNSQLPARPPWPLLQALPREEKFDVSLIHLPMAIDSRPQSRTTAADGPAPRVRRTGGLEESEVISLRGKLQASVRTG